MKFRNPLLACFVLTLLPAPVLACSCAPWSLGFCQALPDIGNANRAAFVGKVTEVYPKSRADMNRLVEEFVQTHRDLLERLRAQSGDTGGRRLAGSPSPDLEWRKQIIEYVWGDRLTSAEREQLRVADQRQLDRLGFDQRRQIHLEVLENFSGANEEQFTLYTALDGPACGFDFVEGETYLIDAYMRMDAWETGSCSRTRSLGEATEDLKVLRAWKAGERLSGRISGRVVGRRFPAAGPPFHIRLVGGKEILETTSDSNDQFAFENLNPGVYEVQLQEPPWPNRPADLSRNWCAMVILPINPIGR